MSERAGRSLLDFIHTPVLVGDPDGRTVYVNPAFETDFLATAEDVAGQPIANLFAGGGREAVLRAVARVCGERSVSDSERFSVIVEDRGYKALASSVEAEGGRVGVILLLVRESAGEARIQSFGREISEPLDEIAASLSTIAEHATTPAQRIALADAVRSLERVRKWTETVAASVKGGALKGAGGRS